MYHNITKIYFRTNNKLIISRKKVKINIIFHYKGLSIHKNQHKIMYKIIQDKHNKFIIMIDNKLKIS